MATPKICCYEPEEGSTDPCGAPATRALDVFYYGERRSWESLACTAHARALKDVIYDMVPDVQAIETRRLS